MWLPDFHFLLFALKKLVTLIFIYVFLTFGNIQNFLNSKSCDESILGGIDEVWLIKGASDFSICFLNFVMILIRRDLSVFGTKWTVNLKLEMNKNARIHCFWNVFSVKIFIPISRQTFFPVKKVDPKAKKDFLSTLRTPVMNSMIFGYCLQYTLPFMNWSFEFRINQICYRNGYIVHDIFEALLIDALVNWANGAYSIITECDQIYMNINVSSSRCRISKHRLVLSTNQ